MLKFIKKVQRKIENICTGIRLILSFAIAIASVSCALFGPTKFLGVPIAAVGCFASGWMFSVCFSPSDIQRRRYLLEQSHPFYPEEARHIPCEVG